MLLHSNVLGIMLSLACFALATTNPSSRRLEVLNDSGMKIIVNWVNPSTGQFVRYSDPYLFNGAKMVVDSFANHSFVFQEVLANETVCSASSSDGRCHASQVKVGEHDGQGEKLL